MSNRHQRRASIAAYRRSVRDNSLLTWLVPIDTMIGVTVLDNAARAWLDCLTAVAPSPSCICCRTPMRHRDVTGAVLLSVPSTSSHLASVCGVCVACFAGDLAVIEGAVERVLGQIVVGGRLEPFEVAW
jgi:hypothetical protein